MDKTNILDVQVDCLTKQQILKQVADWRLSEKPRLVTYVNAHCLNVAHDDRQYQAILNQADLVYPDGFSVVVSSRFLGGCQMEKVTGRDWIADFCQMAAACGLKVYFLAGRPGVAEKATGRLQKLYPELKIVGCCDGYFKQMTEAEALADIQAAQPDVLLVGMGVPRQEIWIEQHRGSLPVRVFWAVGAAIDYVAGVEAPVPAWMNAIGLEWLWRMMMDPWGKWRRYLVGLPLFGVRILSQKLVKSRIIMTTRF